MSIRHRHPIPTPRRTQVEQLRLAEEQARLAERQRILAEQQLFSDGDYSSDDSWDEDSDDEEEIVTPQQELAHTIAEGVRQEVDYHIWQPSNSFDDTVRRFGRPSTSQGQFGFHGRLIASDRGGDFQELFETIGLRNIKIWSDQIKQIEERGGLKSMPEMKRFFNYYNIRFNAADAKCELETLFLNETGKQPGNKDHRVWVIMDFLDRHL